MSSLGADPPQTVSPSRSPRPPAPPGRSPFPGAAARVGRVCAAAATPGTLPPTGFRITVGNGPGNRAGKRQEKKKRRRNPCPGIRRRAARTGWVLLEAGDLGQPQTLSERAKRNHAPWNPPSSARASAEPGPGLLAPRGSLQPWPHFHPGRSPLRPSTREPSAVGARDDEGAQRPNEQANRQGHANPPNWVRAQPPPITECGKRSKPAIQGRTASTAGPLHGVRFGIHRSLVRTAPKQVGALRRGGPKNQRPAGLVRRNPEHSSAQAGN